MEPSLSLIPPHIVEAKGLLLLAVQQCRASQVRDHKSHRIAVYFVFLLDQSLPSGM